MKIENADDLLEHMIQDLYSAEKQILQALPKMEEAATNNKLKDGFRMHNEQTKVHVERLEKVAEMLGVKFAGVKCHGMEGLLKEGDEAIKEIEEGELLDPMLVAGARTVEHYEMLKYEMLMMMLQEDDPEAVAILKDTYDEEAETDKKLSNMIAD